MKQLSPSERNKGGRKEQRPNDGKHGFELQEVAQLDGGKTTLKFSSMREPLYGDGNASFKRGQMLSVEQRENRASRWSSDIGVRRAVGGVIGTRL